MNAPSLPSGFWSIVEKSETCWIWTGSTSPDGYGRAGTHETFGTSLPHRAAWIVERGPIPDGLELDHLCGNRACVRVDHLEPVTHEENVRRAVARRTHCRNGHPYDDENRVPQYDKPGARCLLCRRQANRESLRRQRARKGRAGQLDSWVVRTWAWQNGYDVRLRGPVPRAVVTAYLNAHHGQMGESA